jgi:hypothetical protein
VNTLPLLAGLTLIGYGFASGGMLGALTGFVAALGIGSGLAILSDQKDAELSADETTKTSQRIGGILAALLCGVGAFYGGWRYGWAWGLGGYIIGALSTVVIALRVK